MNQIKSGSLGNDREFGEIKISMKKIQKKQVSTNNSTQIPIVEEQRSNETYTQKNETKSVRKIVEEQISEILTYTPQNLTIQGGRVFNSNQNQNNKLNEQLADLSQSSQDVSGSEDKLEDQILQAIISVDPDQQYEALKYIFKKRQIDLERMQNIFVMINNKQLNLTIHQIKKLSTKYDFINLFNQVLNEQTLQEDQISKKQKNLKSEQQQEEEQQFKQEYDLKQTQKQKQEQVKAEQQVYEEQLYEEQVYEVQEQDYQQTDKIISSIFPIPLDYKDNLMDLEDDFDELEEESGNQNNEYEYENDNDNENDEIDLADQFLAEQINSYLQQSNFEENVLIDEEIDQDSYFDNNDDEIPTEEEEEISYFLDSEEMFDYANTLLNKESYEEVFSNGEMEELSEEEDENLSHTEDKLHENDLDTNQLFMNILQNQSSITNQSAIQTENILNLNRDDFIQPQIFKNRTEQEQLINFNNIEILDDIEKLNESQFDKIQPENNEKQNEYQEKELESNDEKIIEKKEITIATSSDQDIYVLTQIDNQQNINTEIIEKDNEFQNLKSKIMEHKIQDKEQQNLLSFLQIEQNNNQEKFQETNNLNILTNLDTYRENQVNQEQLQDFNLNVKLFETIPIDPTLDIDNTIVDSSENYQELPIVYIEPESYYSNQDTHMNATVEIIKEVYDIKQIPLVDISKLNLIQELTHNSQEEEQEQEKNEQYYIEQQQQQQQQEKADSQQQLDSQQQANQQQADSKEPQQSLNQNSIPRETINQSSNEQLQSQQELEFQDKSQEKEQDSNSHVVEIKANFKRTQIPEPSQEDIDRQEDLELNDDEKQLNAKKRHSKRYPAKSIENERITEDVKYVPVEDPQEDIFIISSLASQKKNNIIDMNTIEEDTVIEQSEEKTVDTVQQEYEENTAENSQISEEPEYSLHQSNQAFVQTMSLKQFKCKNKDKSYGQHQLAKDFVCQCSDTIYLLDEETWYLAGIINQYKKYEKIFEKIKKSIPLTYVSTNEKKACWASEISQPIIMNDFIQSLGFQTSLQNSFIQIPKIVQMEYFQLQVEENEFKEFKLKISIDDQQVLQQGITFTQIKTELTSDSLIVQYFGNLKVNKQQLLFSLKNKYGNEMEDQIEINVSLPQDEPICLLFCEQILSGDIAQQLKTYLRFKKGQYKITVKVLRSENNFEISYNIQQ